MKLSKLLAFFLLLGAVVLVVVGIGYIWVQSKENRSGNDSNYLSFVVEKNITKDSVETNNDRKENYPTLDEKILPPNKDFPKSARFSSVVNETLKKLSYERIEMLINNFSSFKDPNYLSDSGVKAAEWLISQIKKTIRNNTDYTGNITIMRFHHSWKQVQQPTVILRFEGSDSAVKSELVLLGVDLDTKYATNSIPGLGDNGGGSAVLLETTRVLLETNFVPKRSIELHWYASGEEEEQRGQTEIAEAYTRSGLNVHSMVTFDTICYFLLDDDGASPLNKATKKHLGKFPHNKTDETLEVFLRNVVVGPHSNERIWNIYCESFECVYDNTSWSAYGVTAAWPIVFPCPILPKNTTHTILNIHRTLNFARLATVYTIEMAEPNHIN